MNSGEINALIDSTGRNYVSITENESCRIRTNEIQDLLRGLEVVKFIK
jgi:hypothetical protein